jgi:glutamyl-tRNA reductase
LEYIVLSFTHKNTDISTREKISFNNEVEKSAFLKAIYANYIVSEAILLSTCNRIELIMSVKDQKVAKEHALNCFNNHSTLGLKELEDLVDIYEDEGAVHHIFTVASSLDSLVVGETQIAGQLKDAFKFSLENEYCGQNLSRVLHYSFKCAARVRNATQLGSGSVSVASTAVAQAKEIYKETNGVRALVIGAGEMSELACRHLLRYGFDVVLCSRDIKKARVLAHSIITDGNGTEYTHDQIDVRPYDELELLLNSMRLMVTATAAPYPIIKKQMVKEFEYTRNWFDIALPRDIEDMDIEGVNIYSVDDLQCIVDENMELRSEQAKEAFSIVGEMTKEYFAWLNTLSAEPVIKDIRLRSDEVIEKKIQNALKKHFIKKEDADNVKKLCQSVMNEFLHTPTVKIKKLANSVEGDSILETTQEIFSQK